MPIFFGQLVSFNAGAGRDFHIAKAYVRNITLVVYTEEVQKLFAGHQTWAGDAEDDNL